MQEMHFGAGVPTPQPAKQPLVQFSRDSICVSRKMLLTVGVLVGVFALGMLVSNAINTTGKSKVVTKSKAEMGEVSGLVIYDREMNMGDNNGYIVVDDISSPVSGIACHGFSKELFLGSNRRENRVTSCAGREIRVTSKINPWMDSDSGIKVSILRDWVGTEDLRDAYVIPYDGSRIIKIPTDAKLIWLGGGSLKDERVSTSLYIYDKDMNMGDHNTYAEVEDVSAQVKDLSCHKKSITQLFGDASKKTATSCAGSTLRIKSMLGSVSEAFIGLKVSILRDWENNGRNIEEYHIGLGNTKAIEVPTDAKLLWLGPEYRLESEK